MCTALARYRRRIWLRRKVVVALCGTLGMVGLGPVAGVPRVAAAATTQSSTASTSCPWLNTALPVSQRVQLLISNMTLDQKIFEMHADPNPGSGPYAGYEGYVPPQPSLCIPALVEQDDSTGVGAGATGVTQLPAEVSLASAWSPPLAQQYGVVNGQEHWGKGIAMALGPGINIQRDPRWGRNFEMMSEDPYLTAQLGVPGIQGLQSTHVLADVKHYVAYNQETYRNTPADNVQVSNRTLHEIYLPAFYDAVTKGQAASVMCSYATINGTYSCQNPDLLTQILDNRWDYQGFVRSDGGATHSTAASVNAGLDQERGSDYLDNGLLAEAVQTGQVSVATINQAVSRIFTQMFQAGLFDHPPTGNLSSVVTTPAHAAFSRTVAEDGTVLLKNAGPVLPLSPSSVKSIAMIGPDGTTSPLTAGGGSSYVIPPYQVSPLQGIQSRAGSSVAVSSYSGTDPAAAAAAARQAQVAIVFASNYETEAKDLPDINLSGNQDQMISSVAAANPDTIVVLNTGGPVVMPWVNQVKGVLEAWYPGQEDGNALAAVLFGDVDPAGHLPETFPQSLSQVPTASPAQFPGVNGQVQYSEGLDVGYRYYDAHDVTPLFPFGYGLSYTTFAFSDLKVTPPVVHNRVSGPDSTQGQGTGLVNVSATVTNTGNVAGADVAQLYVGDPAAAGEPPRQLKGFQRVSLQPHQSTTVHFSLDGHDLSYFDDTADGWVLPDGGYSLSVGDSSAAADLPLHGSFTVARSVGARYATINAPSTVAPDSTVTVTATFVNDGDYALHHVQYSLQAPAGWTVQPVGAAPTTLLAGQSITRTFQVSVPEAAQGTSPRLTAELTAAPSGGGQASTMSAAATVTVEPGVTVTPSAVTTVGAGQSAPATLTLTSHLPHPVVVHYTASPPSGVTVTPASSSVTVPAQATTTTNLTVSVSSGQPPGSYPVPLTLSFSDAGGTYPLAPSELHVVVPYSSLAAAYDNAGISNDSDISAANFDGYGNSYSEQALTAAGLPPGKVVTSGGVTYTWPSVPGGTADNVLADGQTIAASGSGSQLGFLGASSGGDTSGTVTVAYTDGTTQTAPLTVDNWFFAPGPGNTAVASTPYINDSTGHGNGGVVGQRNQRVYVFAASVALQSSKTVVSVTLPAVSDTVNGGNAMHLFSMSLG